MVRIGGKGMRYIVKNCPCFVLGIAMKGNDKKVQTCNNYRISELTHCSDIADCVIKQVIEKCKGEAVINYPKKEKEFITVNGYQAILNMFDIKEINK